MEFHLKAAESRLLGPHERFFFLIFLLMPYENCSAFKKMQEKSFQDEIAVLHNVHYTIMDLFPGSSNICSIDHAQNILNPDRGGNFRAFNL